MELALNTLRNWGADCVGIGSRTAIAAPWHWEELEKTWPTVFSAVDYSIEVEVSLN
jgi:hypothetical protein